MIPLLYAIEYKEAGVWTEYQYTENLLDACHIASNLTENVREEWIRILTPDNKIL